MKLALHYWKPDFAPSQAKQFYNDYLEDLKAVTVYELERACAVWRQSSERFFPTSGQLMEKNRVSVEASIASRRAAAPAFRGYPALEDHRAAKNLKPWRQILHEKGLDWPKGSGRSPLDASYDPASPLDALQPR